MNSRIAVIDLGTNTFNLVIAEKKGQHIHFLSNTKESVKLGRGGIANNIILPDAINRAMAALEIHNKTIQKYNVGQIRAIGTSALRTAKNASELIEKARVQLGFEIEIISGNREAELIFKGVRLSLEEITGAFLILDIGGGSNEFILSDGKKILWKESFPIGMARLIERFRLSDPITLNEIGEMEAFFSEQLQPLFKVCSLNKVKKLIGAEGAFESFYNCIRFNHDSSYIPQQLLITKEIPLNKYFQFHQKLLQSTITERMATKGIEPYRVEMVVPASVFVNFVVKKLGIDTIAMSPYSLKEGLVSEIFSLI